MLNLPVKHASPLPFYFSEMETMGDRIKALRQARGLTQTQLANACGVTKAAVSQWENGSTASIKLPTVLSVVAILRTDLAYLVYGADRSPPEDGDAHKPNRARC